MSLRGRERGIWLLSIGVLSATAWTLHNPGSLDACYHLHVAQNLASGRGMVEDLIWNYLDKSQVALALPHPSHLYWMPMTTWIAWLGLVCFGPWFEPFRAAQLPFVLLASLLPLLAYRAALRLWNEPNHALLTAWLCLLAPSYLPMWVVPEPNTPFCLAAALTFEACGRATAGQPGRWWFVGLGVGAAHLTRADGALLLPVMLWQAGRPRPLRSRTAAIGAVSGVLLGYLVVMTPWFARNLSLTGAPLPWSVSRTAWLHVYDEIFSYQIPLSAARWFAADPATLLRERGSAALKVLVQFFSMYQLVLPPLALVGYRSLAARARPVVQPALAYAALLLASMCFVFPQPALFGTLFRGASAIVPWGMALVPGGLAQVARAYGRLRRYSEAGAQAAFGSGLALVIALVAVVFQLHRLYGVLPYPERLWNRQFDHYRELDAWLRARGADGPVLVVDPPGYTLATGRPSIMLPSDGAPAVLAAADRFGARWLVLESNVPSLRAALSGQTTIPGFRHVRAFRDETGSTVRLMTRVALGARPDADAGSEAQLRTANR